MHNLYVRVFVSSGQGAADGVWTHDKFQDGGARRGMRGAVAPVGAGGGGASTKITVSNLHYGVSDADIIVSERFKLHFCVKEISKISIYHLIYYIMNILY